MMSISRSLSGSYSGVAALRVLPLANSKRILLATAGWMKPDARIYEAALSGLGLEASECLFVGDGQNDELAGAERVGMTPVLLESPASVHTIDIVSLDQLT